MGTHDTTARRRFAVGAVVGTLAVGAAVPAAAAVAPHHVGQLCVVTLGDDAFSMETPGSLGTASGVLFDNDEECGGTAVLVAAPTNAIEFSLFADGSFFYRPLDAFVGTEEFQYRSSVATTPVATVRITVTACGWNAVDDSYTVTGGETLSIGQPGVTGNDHLCGSFFVDDSSAPPHGSLAMNTNGSFTYTPTDGFVGTDSFGYTLWDPAPFELDSATVHITVVAPPCAPDAADDSYTVQAGRVLHVTAPGVGANDTVCPGDNVFELVDGPANGTASMAADGGFTYTPDPGFVGADSFTYDVNDSISDFASGPGHAGWRRPTGQGPVLPRVVIEVTAAAVPTTTAPPATSPPTTSTPTTTMPTPAPTTSAPTTPPTTPPGVLPATS